MKLKNWQFGHNLIVYYFIVLQYAGRIKYFREDAWTSLFEKTTIWYIHSLLAAFTSSRGCARARAFHIRARTNTCLCGISGYSGMPAYIEIRWANDRNHRIAFCRYPLWRLIGSYCACPAESSYVIRTRNARNSHLCNMYALARTRD